MNCGGRHWLDRHLEVYDEPTQSQRFEASDSQPAIPELSVGNSTRLRATRWSPFSDRRSVITAWWKQFTKMFTEMFFTEIICPEQPTMDRARATIALFRFASECKAKAKSGGDDNRS